MYAIWIFFSILFHDNNYNIDCVYSTTFSLIFSHLFSEYSIHKKQKCGDRTFQCFSGKCIHVNFACDGEYDCEDKSDEAPDLCKAKIGKCVLYAYIFISSNLLF